MSRPFGNLVTPTRNNVAPVKNGDGRRETVIRPGWQIPSM